MVGVAMAENNIYEMLVNRLDGWLWLYDFWETETFHVYNTNLYIIQWLQQDKYDQDEHVIYLIKLFICKFVHKVSDTASKNRAKLKHIYKLGTKSRASHQFENVQ